MAMLHLPSQPGSPQLQIRRFPSRSNAAQDTGAKKANVNLRPAKTREKTRRSDLEQHRAGDVPPLPKLLGDGLPVFRTRQLGEVWMADAHPEVREFFPTMGKLEPLLVDEVKAEASLVMPLPPPPPPAPLPDAAQSSQAASFEPIVQRAPEAPERPAHAASAQVPPVPPSPSVAPTAPPVLDLDRLEPTKARRVGVVSVANAVAASGTHNALLGLRDFFARPALAGSKLIGIRNLAKVHEFDIDDRFTYFLNQAGSDLLPTIHIRFNDMLLQQVTSICDNLQLNGLVFLCGPSEVRDIARIAEHLHKERPATTVATVLHSVSGWATVPEWIQTNLGFDSACAILCEVAGNLSLSRQALNRDIYHFVSCGSSTLTVEVAMQIRPTLCYVGEELLQREMTLEMILEEIVEVIVNRHHDYRLHAGVIMISDDFFPKLYQTGLLRQEMHRLRREKPAELCSEDVALKMLPDVLARYYALLPSDVQNALVFRTDGIDGLPTFPFMEAERVVGNLVARRLALRGASGKRTVTCFEQHPHSLRHIALSPMPTVLDCKLGYSLGHVAGALIEQQKTGYMANVRHIEADTIDWQPCAIPLARLLKPSLDGAHLEPIAKRRQLTKQEDGAFKLFALVREKWRYAHSYRQPGPLQYWSPSNPYAYSWWTYTLRAELFGTKEIEQELMQESDLSGCGDLPDPSKAPEYEIESGTMRLVRRHMIMLSPLQKSRLGYQPNLPQVLQGPNRLAEEYRKGRVCPDEDLLRKALPSLASSGQHKEAKLEVMPDQELNVLQLLPEKPKRERSGGLRRDDSLQGMSSHSEGNMAVQDSPSSSGAETRGKGSKSSSKAGFSSPKEPISPVLGKFDLRRFHQRIGLVLIGRSGPGVNNVIMGLFDYLQVWSGTVVCITMGIAGLVNCYAFELTEELLAPHRNQGGCDLLGQSQPEDIAKLGNDLQSCANTCRRLKLDGLVVWGGRNVHSWTARLAEYFSEHKVRTCVVGIPASVQSDLPLIEQTLGYDTVCKLYSSIVGNLAIKAASSGSIWCFVRIPGRSISHIAAEVALLTHPHVVLMSSDTGNEQLGLTDVTQMICNVIEIRSKEGNNNGVVLVPDQLLASVFEMKQLFREIYEIYTACPECFANLNTNGVIDMPVVQHLLPPLTAALFKSMPERVRVQICRVVVEGEFCRGGNIDLGTVETEVIFKSMVEGELTRRVVMGKFRGPFQAITYSLPYQARAALPSNFDCDLGYTIGYTAGTFVAEERTGVLVDVTKLKEDVKHWEVFGTPISSLLTFHDGAEEETQPKYHIQPRSRLLYDISYERSMPEPEERTVISPGPVQFSGPIANLKTRTLCMPQVQRVKQMAICEDRMARLKSKVVAGCPPEVLKAVNMLLKGGVDLLRQL